MEYDYELMDDIIYDLADYDRLVLMLIIVRRKAMLKTRIQKESLIFNQAYGNSASHEAYYFGGYSDDIDESYSTLSDMGLLHSGADGFSLTPYGRELTNRIEGMGDGSTTFERVTNLEKALGNIDDRSLVAITYHLFPKLAQKSTIAGSVDPLIKSLRLNGKPLTSWSKEEFLSCVSAGEPIVIER